MNQPATNLNDMTGPQLVALHNQLVEKIGTDDFKPISGPWKRPVEVLRGKIVSLQSALGTFEEDKPEPKKAPKKRAVTPAVGPVEPLGDLDLAQFKSNTVRETSLKLICFVVGKGEDGRTIGLPYDQVIEAIKRLFPDANTTPACLRWYAVKVRGEEAGYDGWKLPQRRPRSLPKTGQ